MKFSDLKNIQEFQVSTDKRECRIRLQALDDAADFLYSYFELNGENELIKNLTSWLSKIELNKLKLTLNSFNLDKSLSLGYRNAVKFKVKELIKIISKVVAKEEVQLDTLGEVTKTDCKSDQDSDSNKQLRYHDTTNISMLSEDSILSIVEFLSMRDIVQLSQVSKKFKKIMEKESLDKTVWEPECKKIGLKLVDNNSTFKSLFWNHKNSYVNSNDICYVIGKQLYARTLSHGSSIDIGKRECIDAFTRSKNYIAFTDHDAAQNYVDDAKIYPEKNVSEFIIYPIFFVKLKPGVYANKVYMLNSGQNLDEYHGLKVVEDNRGFVTASKLNGKENLFQYRGIKIVQDDIESIIHAEMVIIYNYSTKKFFTNSIELNINFSQNNNNSCKK